MKKLLWDFFGPHSEGTARHFEVHLKQFLARNGLSECATGQETIEHNHHATYCVVPEHAAEGVARTLRAKRAVEVPASVTKT